MMSDAFLFITRNFPPQVGGLENYSYHLIQEFQKRYITHKITLGRSKKHLGWFLPYCCFKALSVYRRHKPGNIHLCDGFLAPVGVFLQWTTRACISITVHGLDVTFDNYFYQRMIPRCIASMDTVVCVSRSTRDACIQRGVARQKCHVIPNGIDPAEFKLSLADEAKIPELEVLLRVSLSGKKISSASYRSAASAIGYSCWDVCRTRSANCSIIRPMYLSCPTLNAVTTSKDSALRPSRPGAADCRSWPVIFRGCGMLSWMDRPAFWCKRAIREPFWMESPQCHWTNPPFRPPSMTNLTGKELPDAIMTLL